MNVNKTILFSFLIFFGAFNINAMSKKERMLLEEKMLLFERLEHKARKERKKLLACIYESKTLKNDYSTIANTSKLKDLYPYLKAIVQKKGENGLLYYGRCGWSLLSAAVYKVDHKAVSYLLTFPNVKKLLINVIENNPLTQAIKLKDNFKMAKLLLNNGANPLWIHWKNSISVEGNSITEIDNNTYNNFYKYYHSCKYDLSDMKERNEFLFDNYKLKTITLDSCKTPIKAQDFLFWS